MRKVSIPCIGIFKRDECKMFVKGVGDLFIDGKNRYFGEIFHDEPHGEG